MVEARWLLPEFRPGPVRILKFFTGPDRLKIGLESGLGQMTRENRSEYRPGDNRPVTSLSITSDKM